MTLHAMARRAAAAAAVALAGACAHGAQPPPFPPAAPTVAPHVATGSYDLATTLPRSQPARAPARPSRSRRQTPSAPPPEPASTLELAFRPLAALDATAPSNTQLSATINLPGYTRAPRGRSGQAAAWWPLPGDSVIVHFQPPQQRSGTIDLRGALKADTLSGDIWYTSMATGNSFQMGTFRAVKRKK